MSELELLTLFNTMAGKETHGRATIIHTLDTSFVGIGLDSMDFLVMGLFFYTWWGVDNEIAKKIVPLQAGQERTETNFTTVREFFDILDKNKTKNPPSIEVCLSEYL